MQQKKFEDLQSVAEQSNQKDMLSMEMFTEDWNSSQFWVWMELVSFECMADVLSTVKTRLQPWQSNYLKGRMRRRQLQLYLPRVSSSKLKTY